MRRGMHWIRYGNRTTCTWKKNLHLAVSMRSFRAENVSAFVKATLDCEVDGARKALAALSGKYPIVLTRI